MVESSWNSNTDRVSGKTWHFSTRKLSGQNLQITSFWSFKEEFHLHSQVNRVTVIWLNRPDDPGMIQTDSSSKTCLSLWSNNVRLMCSLFSAFYKEKKKQTWYIHARASVWIRLKSGHTSSAAIARQTWDWIWVLTIIISPLTSQVSVCLSAARGQWLFWDWNLERKAESRKKVCLESEVLSCRPTPPPKKIEEVIEMLFITNFGIPMFSVGLLYEASSIIKS